MNARPTGPRTSILAIDTATTRVVVAARSPGRRARRRPPTWPAGYRHGETLLPASTACSAGTTCRGRPARPSSSGRARGVHRSARRDRDRQGPGARPERADRRGRRPPRRSSPPAPTGRGPVCCRPGRPIACCRRAGHARDPPAGGHEPELAPHGDARGGRPARARPGRRVARGRGSPCRPRRRAARDSGLPGSPPATWTTWPQLVPEYVTLPRGVRAESGEVAWSHDLR